MASNITDAGKLIWAYFLWPKVSNDQPIADDYRILYYTKSHKNKFQYNKVIHITLGIQLFWVPYGSWLKKASERESGKVQLVETV